MTNPSIPHDLVQDRQAQVEAWRASGADQVDPIGFLKIAHLVPRLAALHGEAQRVLAMRIDNLIQRYAAAIERDRPLTDKPAGTASALAELLAYMSAQQTAQASSHPSAAYPALPWLDEFRDTWSSLSTRRRLHDARGQVPKNAGPLNSNGLVHRALTIMQALSPDYLRSFLAYAETLASLESLNGMNGAPRKTTARGKAA